MGHPDQAAAVSPLAAPAAIGVATTRFFVNIRVASRVMAAATVAATGRLPPEQAAALAAAFILYDLALTALLRRRRLPLALRLPLDCADVAGWCVLVGGPLDPAALPACPLAFETALRGWRRGALVTLLVGGSAGVALVAAGSQPAVAPFLWPAAGALGGVVISRYLDRQLVQRLREADAEHEATASRARLAGQGSVAFGRDTVVDAATRVWPLLAGTGPVPRSPLAAWRQRLAESIGDHAEFLDTALRNWQVLHNSADPDLTHDVEFRVREGDGTLLLVPSQVELLGHVLTELRPRGRVTVSAVGTGPLGQERRLVIDGRPVRLAADPGRVAGPYDLGPLIIGLSTLGSLAHCLPSFEAVPWPAGVALACAGLLLAWRAHLAVRARGAAARPGVVAAALLFGAVDAVTSTLLMRNLTSGGLIRVPFLYFLDFVIPLVVFSWPDLRRAHRWAVVAASAAIVAAGTALQPAPPQPRDLVILV